MVVGGVVVVVVGLAAAAQGLMVALKQGWLVLARGFVKREKK